MAKAGHTNDHTDNYRLPDDPERAAKIQRAVDALKKGSGSR